MRFVPNASAQAHGGYSTVVVDVARVDEALARDPGMHVGPGGSGAAIGGRYEEFRRFLARARADGTPVEQPRAAMAAGGEIAMPDGRHRFAVFRDEGQAILPVSVPRSDAARVRRLYGAKP